MGHSPVQNHTFSCGSCGEEMSIEVIKKPEIASMGIHCVSNCEESAEEGLIVNLHPDFPIPEDQLHVDLAFPWLGHVQDLAKRQIELGATTPQFSSFEEYRRFALGIQTPLERWAIVKKAWSLSRNGKDKLSKAELEKYNFNSTGASPELREVLFHFCRTLLNRGLFPLFTHAAELLAVCHQRAPQEFSRFKRVHGAEWFPDHLDGYFDVFSEYFRDFGEFSQTLLICQYDLPLQENATASSTAFSRIKMFYGNAFELLTGHFVVLACLNNILRGRPFDEFQSMNLKKYLTTNKANRANPFADTQPFAAFSCRLDSTLRNASHHGAIKLDQARKQISYRSGGTGAEHKMLYTKYLVLCNDHILKLAALLMLELVLAL
ncbi:MAG: hypothetical protein DID89_2727545983 [Candidatus Nitrotoga sp. CP45]|nr:MAG: hypothetical protein DID89_2727545983 [Candidatus Nitrotoga sp. CP45]